MIMIKPSHLDRRDQLLQGRDRDRTGKESAQTERDVHHLHQRKRSVSFSLILISTGKNF